MIWFLSSRLIYLRCPTGKVNDAVILIQRRHEVGITISWVLIYRRSIR